MRKLDPIKGDALNFIKNVISSSHKGKEFKNECSNIVDTNKSIIKQYDTDFNNNTIENLENKGQLSDKETFLSLYSYRKKNFIELRTNVLTKDGYINETCPLCECDSASTLDHYLPKEKYPLFVVHPRNLIPCCTFCNEHKGESVFENGRRKYWNCYIDKPINTRFLFCDVTTNNNRIHAEFRVDTKNLSEQEAAMINNTMSFVLNQYKKQIRTTMLELIKSISNLMWRGDSFEDGFKKIHKVEIPPVIKNDWKEVLKEALLKSDDFKKYAEIEATILVNNYKSVI